MLFVKSLPDSQAGPQSSWKKTAESARQNRGPQLLSKIVLRFPSEEAPIRQEGNLDWSGPFLLHVPFEHYSTTLAPPELSLLLQFHDSKCFSTSPFWGLYCRHGQDAKSKESWQHLGKLKLQGDSCTVNQSSRYSLGRCRPGTSHGTPEVVLQQSFPRVRSPRVKKHLAVFHCNQKHSCALRFYFKAGLNLDKPQY